MDENQQAPATDEQLQPGEEGQEPETTGEEGKEEAQAEGKQEAPKNEEAERERAKAKSYEQRFAAAKGDKVVLANMAKKMMADLGLSYDEVSKYAGISAEDLKSRIEKDEPSDPVAAHNVEFDKLYVNGGVKATLDEVYGADTQPFVDAFGRYGLSDPEIREEYLATEPSKLPAFVVKQGKKLMEDMGDSKGSPVKVIAAQRKEIAELKAQLAAKGQEQESTTETGTRPRGNLPVNGASSSVGNSTAKADGTYYAGL